MPSYPFLLERTLRASDISSHLRAVRKVGVPYSDEMIEAARADLEAQQNPDSDTSGIEKRYPKIPIGAFDGDPSRLTEMDALIAYLQVLGTLVDFSAVTPQQLKQ